MFLLYICILGLCGSFCFPCQQYQSANDLGQSGILCCLLGMLVPCVPVFCLRGEARERYGIEVRKNRLKYSSVVKKVVFFTHQ